MRVGDRVKIRGDLRRNLNGQCAYLPEQLVDGKYVKHTGTGEAWVGTVTAIKGDEALVGGGWRGVEMYEVV